MLSWIPMNTRISGQPASVLLTLRTVKPFLEHMHLVFFCICGNGWCFSHFFLQENFFSNPKYNIIKILSKEWNINNYTTSFLDPFNVFHNWFGLRKLSWKWGLLLKRFIFDVALFYFYVNHDKSQPCSLHIVSFDLNVKREAGDKVT